MPFEGVAVLVITGQGIRKSERKRLLRSQEREIRHEIRGVFLPRLANDSILMLRKEAPKWTGNLHRGIGVSGQNLGVDKPNIRIGVSASSDKGFDYVNATRFGRRAIEAKGRSTPARTYTSPPGGRFGGGQVRPFRARMLSFEHTETIDPIYRRRVRAYRPGGDWVRRAESGIRAAAQKEFQDVQAEIQDSIERWSFITGKPTGRGSVKHSATVRIIR